MSSIYTTHTLACPPIHLVSIPILVAVWDSSNPPSVNNTDVSLYNDVVTYTCDVGMRFVDGEVQKTLRCTSGGANTQTPPQPCMGKSHAHVASFPADAWTSLIILNIYILHSHGMVHDLLKLL